MKKTSSLFIFSALLFSVSAYSQQSIINKLVVVEATNDEWTQTGIAVAVGDILILEEQGNKILLGPWLGEVDANGLSSGEGVLERKIATGAGIKVGIRYFETVKNGGILKLKVADKKYEDNKGNFLVKVTVIPAKLIPEAEEPK